MTILRSFSLFIISFLFCSTIIHAVAYPQPIGYVNDFASLYSEPFRTTLEGRLSQLEKDTSAELSIVTVNSLEGTDIERYAEELFEQWKIGQRGQDNGVLLLIAKEDRQIRIEVGYGMEERITDGRAGEIIRASIGPNFKEGNYERGTEEAVIGLETYIKGGEMLPVSNQGKSLDIPVVPILFFGYIVLTYVASFLGRTKAIWPGAVIGGVLGGVGGLFLWSILGLVSGVLLAGLFGLFLDWLLSKNYQYRASHHLPTGFWPSAGGFSSTRTFGGGFGGFGGGRSGGGGASGRW